MNITHLTKQPTVIVRILLFSIGIMLSCNVFAVKPIKPPPVTYVTQADFDAAIADLQSQIDGETAARIIADEDFQNQIDAETAARIAADADLQQQIDAITSPPPPPPPSFYAVGDTGPAGGIVFYVTEEGLHGLEAAPADHTSLVEWGCDGQEIDGADGFAVGTGAQNTADILAQCTEANIAAQIADNYSLNDYTDWFLPSKHELNLLFLQKDVVGGWAPDDYWSSSEYEYDYNYVWVQGFHVGNQYIIQKWVPLSVRAIRAF